jgi:hypothetical protein
MITIAANQHYKFSYDEHKNRVYFRMSGYWKNPEVVPEYLQDWGAAIKLTRPGFTLVADVSEMITHPASVKQLHEKAMDLCNIGGIGHVAEISPSDKIAVLQTAGMADKTQLKYTRFQDQASADTFLDNWL